MGNPQTTSVTRVINMGFRMLSLLLVAAILTGGQSTPARRPKNNAVVKDATNLCPQGQIFSGECGNACVCNADNGATMCTRRGCEVRETPADFQWTKGLKTNQGQTKTQSDLCPQGEMFYDECGNGCLCNPENGVTGCTRMGCEVYETPADFQWGAPVDIEWTKGMKTGLEKTKTQATQAKRSKNVAVAKQAVNLCPKGETFSQRCNTCWCNPENGATMCTLRGCMEQFIYEP